MSGSTSMNMQNCMVDIMIYIRSIKFQLFINKMLHNVCDQAGLQGSKQTEFQNTKWKAKKNKTITTAADKLTANKLRSSMSFR